MAQRPSSAGKLGGGLRSVVARAGERVLTSLRGIPRNETIILTAAAVLMGVLGGVVSIVFRTAFEGMQWLVYGAWDDELISTAAHLPWWQILAVTSTGGFLVGALNQSLFNGRRGQGIANIMEYVHLHDGRMPLRHGLISSVLSATSIGIGGSVGREGAILHLTNTAASQVGQRVPVSNQHIMTLLGCGTAASVGASFNAPIAGVFFALEVILGHYTLTAFAPVVISSVVGTMISRMVFGDFPAFAIPDYEIATYLEIPAFMVLGALTAFVGMLFMWSVFFTEDTMNRALGVLRLPRWVKPGVGGTLLGVIAIFVPHVLGVGYQAVNAALNQELALGLLLILPVFKIMATSVCVGGGFGGGIFSPSLFVGATVGGAFGVASAAAFPEFAIQPGLYAVIGMAAMGASVLGAPITGILIIFELTGQFQTTLAVMAGAAVAALLTNQMIGHSYYTWQLARRGVRLKGGRARMTLKRTLVKSVCHRHFQVVPQNMKLNDLKQLLHLLPEDQRLFVVGENNTMIGTVSLADIKDVAFDPLVYEEGIEAFNVAYEHDQLLALTDTLEDALDSFERSWDDALPVVERRDTMVPAGMITRQQVVHAYNEALLQAEQEYSR